jgi:hypothetical protein
MVPVSGENPSAIRDLNTSSIQKGRIVSFSTAFATLTDAAEGDVARRGLSKRAQARELARGLANDVRHVVAPR